MRVIKHQGNKFLAKLIFIVTGIIASVWFLIRVIPKPQRATYPCMQASAPLMSGFIIYLLTLSGSVLLFKKFFQHVLQRKFLYAGLMLVLVLISVSLSLKLGSEDLKANDVSLNVLVSNAPSGEARGIFPGRVAWIYKPGVATWDEVKGNWWDDANISEQGVVQMLSSTLLSVSGTKDEAQAWDAIFKYFNKTKRKLNQGYSKNEKIAIKINVNNTYSHENTNELNASPQMVYALLNSLVNKGGVPQECITVFDASRFITNNIFDKCHRFFPNVIYLDNVGGDGRTKSTYTEKAIPYSVDNGKLAQGLANCAIEANYLINLALLKGHVGQGVTLCAKNYYGVTSIFNDWHYNAHNNFNQDKEGNPKYITFVDFLGHKDLGEKTMLFLIDGLFGSKSVNGPPAPKWKMEPFNNNWACSLFGSLDGVAIDAVGLDFLRNEWPDAPDMKYSEMYLTEAARADNPPSKTFYDPEKDGVKCKSLGVYEHWNNPTDKKYSRNLGTGKGIELMSVKL
jgi:uncharacterized protein (DUF362 family)